MPVSLLHPPPHTRRRTAHDPEVERPTTDGLGAANRALGNITLPLLCTAAAIALLSVPMATSDDGASTVPFVALLGIALASVRWQPDLDTRPSRSVTLQSALLLATVGVGIVAALARGIITPSAAVGPVITVAVTSSYLLVWGCLLYTSPSPRDRTTSRMPSSA